MELILDDIKNLSVPQKAEFFKLLQDDVELKNYLLSHDKMFEELAHRDKDYEEGKIQLTTRQQLNERLNNRRNAL